MNPSDGLWQTVRADQDQARERAAYLAEAKGRRRPWRRATARVGRRPWIWAAAALCLVCTLGFTIASHRRKSLDLGFSVGLGGEAGRVGAWIAAPNGGALPLQFSDGTLFSLSAGSRARVSAIDASGARFVLERGRATAAVVHRAASHWLVDVGPFEVTVVGTRFDVSWDANDEVFRLQLHEGAVLVSGPCLREPRPIARGEALRVFCKAGQEEIVETRGDTSGANAEPTSPRTPGTDVSPAADSETDRAPAVPSALVQAASVERGTQNTVLRPPSSPDVMGSGAWRTLTSTGRFREALELVERRGFDEECGRASGADLLVLGDAARFSGNSTRARQAYLAARAKLAGGGRSAYSLGLTAFDQEKDYALAARWFEVYLREQPDGRLRGEAEGRLIEAWQRAGDHEKARMAAERYLQDYPDGTQAPLARQLSTR